MKDLLAEVGQLADFFPHRLFEMIENIFLETLDLVEDPGQPG